MDGMRLARGVFAALALVTSGALAAPPDGSQAPTPNFVANPHPFGLAGRPHVLPMRTPGYFAMPRSAPAGAHLTYYGGRVVSNMQVVQVLWGTGSYLAQVSSTGTPSMASFYQQSLNSAYVDWLAEYNTAGLAAPTSNQVIGRGSFLGQFIITPSITGATVDDTQIQTELSSQIAAGHLPAPTTDAAGNANTYYAVYFPAGKTITQGGTSSCAAGGFCAYHGTISSATAELLYGVHPDMQPGSGCDTGCGSASTSFGNQTSVASHEMVETITDAEVGLATVSGPPLAWYDSTNGEIGDICNAQQGSFLGNDGITYTVQQEFSNRQNNCVISAATATDFSISANPASVSIAPGGSATSTISTTVTAGGAGTVSLTVSGAPAGVSAVLTPTAVGAGNSASLAVSSTTAAAPGTYTVTVVGIEGSASHSTTVSLTITGSQDFSLSASPASATVTAGGSTSSTISTAVTSGSAGTVSLGVSGVPSGATASLSPTSVTAGGSSTLSVNTGTAAAGSYTLTVTGVEGSKTHSASFALTITSPILPDFSIAASPASATVAAGGSASSTISTAVTAGSAGTVSLSVSGLPSGASASLSPTSVTAGGSSTLSVNAGTAAPGSYTLTVTGVEGTKTHATAFVLSIASPSDFSISASPSTLALAPGGSGSSTISTAVTSGSAGAVALTVSGLPSGATASLSPTSVTAGGSSTLTVNAGTAAAGSYSVTVTGTEGAASHSTSVSLAIGGIVNGGFETGTLSGWTPSGAANAVVSAGCHSGSYCAQIGATVPSNGNSSLAQTFVVPSGKTSLSLFYKVSCPSTASRYDGVTIALADLTRGRTTTLLARTCTNTGAFAAVTASVVGGHSYKLTVTTADSHRAQLNLVYTLLDDVGLLP